MASDNLATKVFQQSETAIIVIFTHLFELKKGAHAMALLYHTKKMLMRYQYHPALLPMFLNHRRNNWLSVHTKRTSIVAKHFFSPNEEFWKSLLSFRQYLQTRSITGSAMLCLFNILSISDIKDVDMCVCENDANHKLLPRLLGRRVDFVPIANPTCDFSHNTRKKLAKFDFSLCKIFAHNDPIVCGLSIYYTLSAMYSLNRMTIFEANVVIEDQDTARHFFKRLLKYEARGFRLHNATIDSKTRRHLHLLNLEKSLEEPDLTSDRYFDKQHQIMPIADAIQLAKSKLCVRETFQPQIDWPCEHKNKKIRLD